MRHTPSRMNSSRAWNPTRDEPNENPNHLSSIMVNGLHFLQNEMQVKDSYPKLDADAVGKAAKELAHCLGIVLGDRSSSEDEDEFSSDEGEGTSTAQVTESSVCKLISLKERYHSIMMFKHRPVQEATLLHFAIWFVSEFGAEPRTVQALLDMMDDPDDVFAPSYYLPGSPKVVFVSAVHLAAGFGLVEVLRMLTDHVSQRTSPEQRMSPESYMSQWAHMCPSGTTVEEYRELAKQDQVIKFYQPIHDSTYGGNADVTLYLLKQQVDPCTENNHHITPLHFVAFVGISGGLEDTIGDDLKKIVSGLQRTGKAVTAKADMGRFISDMGTKKVTPLEVAVQDASRFPQEHLGLLAPCMADGSGLTYFDEIKTISDVTAEGALRLVQIIAERGRENLNVLRRFRINAQMKGKSDVLASILYTAPRAASDMLELLEVNPEVEDAAHHPLPAKTSLWGLFQNQTMRCTYQSDVVKKQALQMPYWEYKARADPKDYKSPRVAAVTEKTWHDVFIPNPKRHKRSTHIRNVHVVVSLLPNILDIDIFMALAHCQMEHLAIMNQKTVQGVVTCLWSNLIEDVWKVEVVFRFFDVWAYVALSVLVQQGEHLTSMCWPVIASGNIYSLVMIGTHLFSVCRKWWNFQGDESMQNMWSPASRWNLSHTILYAAQTFIGSALVIDLAVKHSNEDKRDSFDDALLALCLLISCFKFIWMWRLSNVGSRIYTIVQTFLASAVNQMLFITFMLLFSFIVAIMVLSRLHSWRLAIDSYRGFLFGDGDGFNGLNMDVDHDYSPSFESNGTLLAFSVFGSFFFNVIVLNIIIAIYGHEYDRLEDDTPKLFMWGRADYCVKTLLSTYLIHWRGPEFNRGLQVITVGCLVGGVYAAKYSLNMWVSALLLATAQVLLPMAMVQCAWFSPEGQDSEDQARYLWICHPPDWMWQSDDGSWENDYTAKQELLETKIESVDDKIFGLNEKIDCLVKKSKS